QHEDRQARNWNAGHAEWHGQKGHRPDREHQSVVRRVVVAAIHQLDDDPAERDHVVVEQIRCDYKTGRRKSAFERSRSRRRRNVHTTAAIAAADTRAWMQNATEEGRPATLAFMKALGMPTM